MKTDFTTRPLYVRDKLTDVLYETCGFRTDYQFIIKSKRKKFNKKTGEGKNYKVIKQKRNLVKNLF